MSFDERDFIPISALQHYLYCPRQCALIHIEQVWADSVDTSLGNILHEKVHEISTESRKNVKVATALPLSSREYGLVGIADVVEFHYGHPYPVEYKKGRPKSHDADRVQLCAQALCLEEMLDVDIAKGSLYYGTPKRREGVSFDEQLRNKTTSTAMAVRQMLAEQQLPRAVYSSRLCNRCSLMDRCQPRTKSNVMEWLNLMLEES